MKEAAIYYELDVDAIESVMKQGLERAMQEGIAKLKNKELLTKETLVTYK
ncbi:hypothetical protein KBC03_02715 [Patescibacteria group bacterium]|nr:hypothetical protein [Patescibacteria group bacterium]